MQSIITKITIQFPENFTALETKVEGLYGQTDLKQGAEQLAKLSEIYGRISLLMMDARLNPRMDAGTLIVKHFGKEIFISLKRKSKTSFVYSIPFLFIHATITESKY